MPTPEGSEPLDSDALGWWTISGVELLKALRRASNGEDPELVYAEYYANSDHEWGGGN
jgi:hypothetical protein